MTTRIHGHRGARGHRPENTLPAIRYALEQGVDGIEIDLCVTSDEQLVLHHDLWLNTFSARTGDGDWLDRDRPIFQLTLAEVQTHDLGRLRPGTAYAREFAGQVPVDGTTAPTFEECVEYIRRWPGDTPLLNIELKGNPPEPGLSPEPDHFIDLFLDAIDRLGLGDDLFVQSFDWRLMHRIHDRRPALVTGLLTNQQEGGPERILPSDGPADGFDVSDLKGCPDSLPALVSREGANAWSCNFLDLTPASLADAHARGLEVYVWTVNEIDDMQRMAEWGVDVITTDYPDRCRQVLDGLRA